MEREVKIVAARCQRHFLILGVIIKLHFLGGQLTKIWPHAWYWHVISGVGVNN